MAKMTRGRSMTLLKLWAAKSRYLIVGERSYMNRQITITNGEAPKMVRNYPTGFTSIQLPARVWNTQDPLIY